MTQFIPVDLDIDQLCENNPPGIKSFQKDKLVHLLHLIYSIPSYNKDIDIIKGYVPMYSEILRRRIPNYKEYLNYLIEAGIIETDNHYVVGSKSKGYRFSRKYRTALKPVEITNKALIRHQLGGRSSYDLSMTRKYRHLHQWFNSDLKINYDAAMEFLRKDLTRKLTFPRYRDFDAKNNCYKDPLYQFNSQAINVERIARRDFRIMIDTNVHRLHSNLTNLKSQLRHYLTYAGKHLVSVDISNSQPYISLALMNSNFWPPYNSTHKGITLYNIGSGISINRKEIKAYFNYIMSQDSPESRNGLDMDKYANLVTQDKFYTYIQDVMTKELGASYSSRKEVKGAVFQFFFTPNRVLNQPFAASKRLFKRLFPNVYDLFALIKEGDHTRLPIMLQRIESFLVLDKVTMRLNKEYPDLPIFTIHDSVATIEGQEHIVKQIMIEELQAAIGFRPNLKIEKWQPSQSTYSNGSLYFGEEELRSA